VNTTEQQPRVKIACENLSKTFIQKGTQRVPVLREVSLEVYDEELLVVLGPGQSGKTTLLRMIAGLETPSEGRVLLDGEVMTGPGPDRGLVFQSYMLFPWKTVLGNVLLGLEMSGVPQEKRREIADHYLNMVGLKGFESYYPHQLSGGMKQRVGIARAFATQPKVMLMDEPFGQLDAQTRFFMEQETERIWLAEKRTMVFVTNNIDEALLLGDRIVTLEGKLPGRVKASYDVDLPRPRDPMDIEFLRLRQEITDAQELTL
jgi:NitT/TauT family transport system ATP-binding protein/sulfonate transport system ATP-binding protein